MPFEVSPDNLSETLSLLLGAKFSVVVIIEAVPNSRST